MFIAGSAVIILGCALFLLLNNVNPGLYFDPPSVMMMAAAAFFPQFISMSFFDFSDSFSYLLKPAGEITRERLRGFRDAHDLAFKTTLGGGLVGCLIGVILVMMNLHDASALGPGAATALMTAHYSLFLSFFLFLPVSIRFKNEILGYESIKYSVKGLNTVFAIGGILMVFVFTAFSILLARGSFGALIIFPDILFLVLCICGSLFLSKGLRPFAEGFRYLISRDDSADKNSIAVMGNIYSLLVKVSIAGGVLLFLMNIIVLMIKLEDIHMIYFKYGTVMMPVVYGLITGLLIFYPVKKALDRKLVSAVLKPAGIGK